MLKTTRLVAYRWLTTKQFHNIFRSFHLSPWNSRLNHAQANSFSPVKLHNLWESFRYCVRWVEIYCTWKWFNAHASFRSVVIVESWRFNQILQHIIEDHSPLDFNPINHSRNRFFISSIPFHDSLQSSFITRRFTYTCFVFARIFVVKFFSEPETVCKKRNRTEDASCSWKNTQKWRKKKKKQFLFFIQKAAISHLNWKQNSFFVRFFFAAEFFFWFRWWETRKERKKTSFAFKKSKEMK